MPRQHVTDSRLTCLASLLLCLAAVIPSLAQTNNQCDQHGEAPDMIVADISGVHRWGSLNGITAFSLGVTTCNIGTCWLQFYGSEPNHPVIAQSLFRLKNGRFEQIGQSWIKHAGAASQDSFCGTCLPDNSFTHLGVLCSDLYDAGYNGVQSQLGPRNEVNPFTGEDFPLTSHQNGDVIYKRLQVKNFDLDPALNPGSLYYAEVREIGADDAQAGRSENNWSYRRANVFLNGSGFDLMFDGPTIIGPHAIDVWREVDPSVTVSQGRLPGDGVIRIHTKVSWLGNGTWRYEYAIENVDSNAAPLAIQFPVPSGVQVTNFGFRDVVYHSDDPQDNTNWARSSTPTTVTWKANTLVLNGKVTNVIRWGTVYNFRFTANAAPGSHPVILGFSDAPSPPFEVSLSIPTLTPSLCDGDGVCDRGETCAACPGDCAQQGGGTGCCGDGVCEVGETAGSCTNDCGVALSLETSCGDGIDGDRDGSLDCSDPDCCHDVACGAVDADGDSYAQVCDCNDTDTATWGTPGEVQGLVLYESESGADLTWSALDDRGGSAPLFDTIRSTDAVDFQAHGACLPSADPTVWRSSDPLVPAAGEAFFYLVRARTTCGQGPLGWSSTGAPHAGPACD